MLKNNINIVKVLDNTTYMLYTCSVDKNTDIIQVQKAILEALAGKIDDFYLAGGTALSLFHFSHRVSEDLDFFTQEFNAEKVKDIADFLQKNLQGSIELVGQNPAGKGIEHMHYEFEFSEGAFIRLDFVRDVFPLIRPTKPKNGIRVLSAEDIYLRKIYAVSGLRTGQDEAGRPKFIGGRQDAKDLFDIYYLSRGFMKLSDFIDKYCNQALKEGVIRWFRTFPRTQMKADLSDIKTSKTIEFNDIDKHLNGEINRILEKEIELK